MQCCSYILSHVSGFATNGSSDNRMQKVDCMFLIEKA